MKKNYMLVILLMIGSSLSLSAQKWSELTDEQKMMKLQTFRDDNQAYLKNTLKLTDEQVDDIDNVNICYLSTLDRIDRYGKTDEGKEKYAKAATAARSAQLDAIMGADNHKQYQAYVVDKLKKAKANMQ